jgi:hypothetical protein
MDWICGRHRGKINKQLATEMYFPSGMTAIARTDKFRNMAIRETVKVEDKQVL